MADAPSIARRTVPVPGGSCNIRMGRGAITALGSGLEAVVGKPRNALVIVEGGVSDALVTDVRRQLSDAGFLASVHELDSSTPIATLSQAEAVFSALADRGITADDAVVAVGGTDTLALGLFACALWRGGVTLALVATNAVAAIECSLTAPGLDFAGERDTLSSKGFPRLLLCDLDHMSFADEELSLIARAYMVQSAMGDSKNAVGALAERAEAIATNDVDVIGEQLLDTFRSRGRISCSNALAVRQSLEYGLAFARGLARLTSNVNFGLAVAEGMRFASRLAAADGSCDIDLVLTQDALLDRLGLSEVSLSQLTNSPQGRSEGIASNEGNGSGETDPEQVEVSIAISPEALLQAIKDEAFKRSNRFMLALPQDLGKVRLAAVEDELLLEHLSAWISARL